jgi:hypothetical protein
MTSGVLHVSQRHAGVEGQGHEGMAQAVGAEAVGAVEAGGPARRRTMRKAAGSSRRRPPSATNSGPLSRPLRRVRAWLTPWVALGRYWRAWSTALPPTQLRLLLDAVGAGRPLHLYLPP